MKNSKLLHRTLEEMLMAFSKRPKLNLLWWGIKQGSFGLIYGPSKSGKTILCEILAMCIAAGRKSFLGDLLDAGTNPKVLFIGLEEFWENRVERNLKQLSTFNTEEQLKIKANYLFQHIDFIRKITTHENWNRLVDLIKQSGATVVIIDSITRMNHGKLEDSETAEAILQRLRTIAQKLKVTLICIHHTPKMYGKPIDLDSIKGSSVFSQEADFAIGINRTAKGNRYVKPVFYRYAPDDSDTVMEFFIDRNTRTQLIGKVEEDEILRRNDRRRDTSARDVIKNYLDTLSCNTVKTADLVKGLKQELPIKERQIKEYLKDLVQNQDILNPKRGVYKSKNCGDGN